MSIDKVKKEIEVLKEIQKTGFKQPLDIQDIKHVLEYIEDLEAVNLKLIKQL